MPVQFPIAEHGVAEEYGRGVRGASHLALEELMDTSRSGIGHLGLVPFDQQLLPLALGQQRHLRNTPVGIRPRIPPTTSGSAPTSWPWSVRRTVPCGSPATSGCLLRSPRRPGPGQSPRRAPPSRVPARSTATPVTPAIRAGCSEARTSPGRPDGDSDRAAGSNPAPAVRRAAPGGRRPARPSREPVPAIRGTIGSPDRSARSTSILTK